MDFTTILTALFIFSAMSYIIYLLITAYKSEKQTDETRARQEADYFETLKEIKGNNWKKMQSQSRPRRRGRKRSRLYYENEDNSHLYHDDSDPLDLTGYYDVQENDSPSTSEPEEGSKPDWGDFGGGTTDGGGAGGSWSDSSSDSSSDDSDGSDSDD